MKKVFEVLLNKKRLTVAELADDCYVSANTVSQPFSNKADKPLFISVNGSKIEGNSYVRLNWIEEELKIGDEIKIIIKELDFCDNPFKVNERQKKEKSCSFCNRNAKEVSLLFKSKIPLASICDECVQECMDIIQNKSR